MIPVVSQPSTAKAPEQPPPPQELLQAVAKSTQPPSSQPGDCPLKKHFVKVKLEFEDDHTPVLAAACKILKGTEEIEGGPLASGELGTATVLEAGSYEVTFPEIDSAEWKVG